MNTLSARSLSMATLEFRFLYGRWIRFWLPSPGSLDSRSDSSMVDEYQTVCMKQSAWLSSDSSMVDEYHLPVGSLGTLWNVQIPLWSMNTRYLKLYRLCQWVQIPLWSMNTLSTKSLSMATLEFRFLYGRWIPKSPYLGVLLVSGSDSSMVDEYPGTQPYPLPQRAFRFLYGRWILSGSVVTGVSCTSFRFLYGRWILITGQSGKVNNLSSDSSMVDEYLARRWLKRVSYVVQIPLWSMNTMNLLERDRLDHAFRFLYGRWIPWDMFSWGRFIQVQIPLWSMNTAFCTCVRRLFMMFRFLYGRWIPLNQIGLIPNTAQFRFLYGRWILTLDTTP